MKKRVLLILFSLLAVFSQKISAQAVLPEASTAEKPVWYYFQVKGSDLRAGRIFHLNGSDVYGKLFSEIVGSRNRYLWRFEKNDDGSYTIISRQGNKQLDTRFDSAKNAEIITAVDSSSVTWELVEYKNNWLIKSSSGRYAVQAGAGSNMEYVIMASTFGSTDNGSYSFLLYDNTTPEISDTKDIWYYIKSAEPTLAKDQACITDINADESSPVKFEVLAKEQDEEKSKFQQWKVIKPENATNNNVFFVNRQTGNIIQTAFDYNGYFNAQSTDDIENSNGWTLTFIDRNQFKISGLDSQNVTGYLNASFTNEPAGLIPGNSEFLNSAFAWAFELVSPRTSMEDVPTPDPFADVKVKIIERRIYVEGTDDYMVSHISGIRVAKDVQLPIGVYLITIQGKTKSYLVK
ncbi:MAG: hypothetical protein LIO93_13075 [Bacteroidales bacterium]|nr:hypothetical protein [Bacteroidales bacterium]